MRVRNARARSARPAITIHSEEQWREASHSVGKSARARMIAAQRKLARPRIVGADAVPSPDGNPLLLILR